MAARELDGPVSALEAEVAQLKQRLELTGQTKKHWVDRVYGAFSNDPDFVEAMRLGRKYRVAESYTTLACQKQRVEFFWG